MSSQKQEERSGRRHHRDSKSGSGSRHRDKKRRRRWDEKLYDTDMPRRKQEIEEEDHEDDLSVKRYSDFRRGRSSSTCRYIEPTFNTTHQDKWRCVVCYLWNDRDRVRCQRCKSKEGEDKVGDAQRKDRDSSRERMGVTNDQSYKGDKGDLRWPPVFETNGASYVFDDRSRMYYEAKSNFFYDPKSKLYYGNHQCAYFRHEPSEDPPFVNVSERRKTPPAKQRLSESSHEVAIMKEDKEFRKSDGPRLSNEPPKATELGGVNVPAKFNENPSSSSGIEISDTTGINSLKDASKSTEELKIDDASQSPSISESRSISVKADRDTSVGSVESIKSTDETTIPSIVKHGGKEKKIVCKLCMRRFVSVDKLKVHEARSELHKTNLLKLNSSKAPGINEEDNGSNMKLPAKVQYVDRASKRRLLYSEIPPVPTNRSMTSKGTFAAEAARYRMEPVKPEAILDEQNIGNQLFQKILQKSKGKPISRHQSNSDNVDNEAGSRKQTANVRKDWERIENYTKGAKKGNSEGLGSHNRGNK